MSGLSHKSHGELNQITSKIMLNEVSGDGVNTGVGGAILGGVANAQVILLVVKHLVTQVWKNYLLSSKGT